MRLHALQYLRAVAALAVVYSHATPQYGPYTELLPYFGAFGVDVFFVISGFIMVWIARDTDTPGRFLVQRIRRVVPLYWFFTAVMAAGLIFAPSVFRNTSFELGSFLKSLFFIPHWSIINPGEVWPIVAPGWSLNYEMYFYLLFAASLFFRPAWRIPSIVATIAVVFFLALVVSSDSALGRFFTVSIVFEFILGMLLALTFKRGMRLTSSAGIFLIIAGIYWFVVDPQLVHVLRFGIPSLLIVAGFLYLELPVSRVGLLLGDSSYALYLSHIFTLGILRKLLPPLLGEGSTAAWMFVLISMIICALVGIVVHWVIDDWLLRSERLHLLRLKRSTSHRETRKSRHPGR